MSNRVPSEPHKSAPKVERDRARLKTVREKGSEATEGQQQEEGQARSQGPEWQWDPRTAGCPGPSYVSVCNSEPPRHHLLELGHVP